MKSEFQINKEKVDSVFRELLRRNNPDSNSLFVYIRMRLKQFNLNKLYEPYEIFNEVYCRGMKALQKGKTINSISGWTRATSFNVIRELSRQRPKFITNNPNNLEDRKQVEPLQNWVEEIDSKTELLSEALEKFTPEEKKLLNYKVVEGLSWQKIQNLKEYQDITVSALRKRKERILKKLREFYHSKAIE